LAIPVVSPNPTSCAPKSRKRAAISSTRPGGTRPSYGHPNAVEITPSQRSPAARARPSTTSSPASDSATERLTFLRLCVSDADRKTLISSIFARCSSAASRPRSLGISTLTATSSGTSMRSSTSAASASCGITSARTKLVTSSRRSPVRASASISSTLRSIGIVSGSF